MPSQKIDEGLLTEHRELIELYMHNNTTFTYLMVNYVIVTTVLDSFFGLILTLRASFNIHQVIWMPPLIGIMANVFAYLTVKRIHVQQKALEYKGKIIEQLEKEKGILIDTFEAYLLPLQQGKTLDANGTYRKLGFQEKISLFWLFYYATLILTVIWIILLIWGYTIF